MKVERDLPSSEAHDLVALAGDIADRELRPRAASFEEADRFPAEVFEILGRAGLLGLPYPAEFGGGGQPYEVYLQVLEELAARWAAVAVGVSVHTLSCFPIAKFGDDQQQRDLLPRLLSGTTLGAYCLSEAHAGSDPSAMRASAQRSEHGWTARGSKAWITHGGHADFYTTFLRTSQDQRSGISCFHIDASSAGLSAGSPERKMGLRSSTTTTIDFDSVEIPAQNLVGAAGQGLPIALAALDSGRLGIAAVAVGIAQGALDHAIDYARHRITFGVPIIEHQGLGFLIADMAAAVESARATYLSAARRHDEGLSFSRQASIAKLIASDAAMRVTTDAVQVLGGAGYVRDHPVERYMREAKITQIFEGTNQIQRMVIARHLATRTGCERSRNV